MSVKLYVRDNTNGNIHEYGTNQHDALILQDDGSLHYQNLQNGCGTMFPDEGYTFCEADGSDPRTRENYIQYGVEPYIDIGGKGEDHTCVTCEWISVKDRLPEMGEHYQSEDVLVCINYRPDDPDTTEDTYVSIDHVDFNCFGQGEFSCERDDPRGGEPSPYFVTHWMPMPEPPKMEKAEE